MIFIISSHLCLLASYISCNPLVGSVTPVRSLFLLRFSTFRYSVLCSPYRSIIGVLPPWKCNIWIGCTSIVVSVDPFKSNLLLMIDIKYCRTYNADIDMSTYNVIVVISHTRYIILIFTSQQLFHDEQQIIEIFYIHVTQNQSTKDSFICKFCITIISQFICIFVHIIHLKLFIFFTYSCISPLWCLWCFRNLRTNYKRKETFRGLASIMIISIIIHLYILRIHLYFVI